MPAAPLAMRWGEDPAKTTLRSHPRVMAITELASSHSMAWLSSTAVVG
jgi:hypothetical protein